MWCNNLIWNNYGNCFCKLQPTVKKWFTLSSLSSKIHSSWSVIGLKNYDMHWNIMKNYAKITTFICEHEHWTKRIILQLFTIVMRRRTHRAPQQRGQFVPHRIAHAPAAPSNRTYTPHRNRTSRAPAPSDDYSPKLYQRTDTLYSAKIQNNTTAEHPLISFPSQCHCTYNTCISTSISHTFNTQRDGTIITNIAYDNTTFAAHEEVYDLFKYPTNSR